jgi:hypothetical protein
MKRMILAVFFFVLAAALWGQRERIPGTEPARVHPRSAIGFSA